jgi:PKD repeat protein
MKLIAGMMVAMMAMVFVACEGDPSPNDQTVAKFSVTGYENPLPATLYFINTSSKATSFMWYFGDGTTSTDANPTHVYNNIGTYFIKLVATGPSGVDSTCKVLYYGDNTDPTKSYFSYLMDRCTGVPVNISFHSLNPASLYYAWDFDNGGSSPLKNPIIQYSAQGNYMVKFSSQINGVRDTVALGLSIF